MSLFQFFMRNCILCILACWTIVWAQAQDIPNPMSPPRLVNDFAGLFSSNENALLESKLRMYHDTTSTQIYVVTVASFNGYDKAQFAVELGEKWGIGQKSKNNGAVILIKPKSEREKGEIFIASGYGLEGALPDATLSRIMDETIVPYFRKNQYYEGVNAGIDRMTGYLSGEFQADKTQAESFPTWLIILAIIVFVVILISSGGKGNNNNSGSRGGFGPTVFFPPSGRRGGFGGFSGGGSFGGGFSGGGGGRFGGGGAGKSW
ncbi:MAG: TPM domain-containing protein [Dysgonamonadaceae bacterium]|jgi:uncharacterized protein|nr:TPM domain-containing protein [Dysgonamonadaceae bacterium]